MTTATEELRKLLEEHGLSCQTHYLNVSWRAGSKLYVATDVLDGTLTVTNLTPEQAVAATSGNNDKSRWFELFGTPERAARTLAVGDKHADCGECVIREACYSSDIGCLVEEPKALLEWLRSDA